MEQANSERNIADRSAQYTCLSHSGNRNSYIFCMMMRGREDSGNDMMSRHEASILNQYLDYVKDGQNRLVFANRNNKKKIVHNFVALPQLNCEDGMREAGQRQRLGRDEDFSNGMSPITRWFPKETQPDRLARALAKRRAIDMKEYCESWEFFTNVRKSKHGLCGG